MLRPNLLARLARLVDLPGPGRPLAVEQFPDARDYLSAVERDRRHDLFMGEAGHAELEIEASRSEVAQVRNDLLRDRFRGADMEGAVGTDVLSEGFLRRRPEAALPGDPSQRQTPLGPEFAPSLLVCFGNVAGRVDADRSLG